MPIECFDAREELAVVATRDKDLGVGSHGGLEDREGAGGDFMFF